MTSRLLSKNKHFFLFCIALALSGLACQQQSTFEERRVVAKAMLQKKFDVVINVATEFVKKEEHPLAAFMVGAIVSSKCDCITDSLAVRFANEYDLETLQEMETKPIESLQLTIEKMLDKDDESVMNCLKGDLFN